MPRHGSSGQKKAATGFKRKAAGDKAVTADIYQQRIFGALMPCCGAQTPGLLPLPLVPLVPPGRAGATVRDRCLLRVQIAAIPSGIGPIFRGIMAPVVP